MVGPKFQNCEAARREVLLIAQVLIGYYKNLESLPLRRIQQFTVADAGPPHLLRGGDLMIAQRVAHLQWNALVKQNPHTASSLSMRCQP